MTRIPPLPQPLPTAAELSPFADLTHSAAAKLQMAATLLRRAVANLTRDPA